MRLGGRSAAAIEVLTEILERHRPAPDALRDWGISHRFAGSGDRNAIGNLVFDSLRRRASQAWRMDADTPAALVLSTLAGQWQYEIDDLTAQFAEDRFAPTLDRERDFSAWLSRDLSQAPGHVRAEIPEWCEPAFRMQFGEEWISEGEALAARPPLDLRVNTLKASPEKALRQLERMHAHPCAHAANGLRIEPPERDGRFPNITATTAYRKGWIEIQDEGSQLAAEMAGASPGEQVMDYCAGAGGKTLALAAQMQNRGQIHAHDADANRLSAIHERLRRAGTRNVQVYEPGDIPEKLKGRMDRVLVDAPCSGSGTWRRRPDAKWRLTEEALAARMGEQDRILSEACEYVRPGGHLVYVTCSVFPEENGKAVERFLEQFPEFAALPVEPEWRDLCNNSHMKPAGQDIMLLTPATTQTDGFFLARLSRNKTADV